MFLWEVTFLRYRWFAKDEEREDELGQPRQRMPIVPAKDPSTRMKRGERAGLALSVVVLLYGAAVQDVPIVFVALAFLLYELRRFTYLLGPRGEFLSNLLQGFSIVMFLGALCMVFL